MKWIWNPKLFCQLQIPPSYDLRRAYIKEVNVYLKETKKAKIRMEILNCEYVNEILLGDNRTKWHSYASAPNGSIFYVQRPQPDNSNDSQRMSATTIEYEVLTGEHKISPGLTLSGVANVFKLFSYKRTNLLYVKMWPM